MIFLEEWGEVCFSEVREKAKESARWCMLVRKEALGG